MSLGLVRYERRSLFESDLFFDLPETDFLLEGDVGEAGGKLTGVILRLSKRCCIHLDYYFHE